MEDLNEERKRIYGIRWETDTKVCSVTCPEDVYNNSKKIWIKAAPTKEERKEIADVINQGTLDVLKNEDMEANDAIRREAAIREIKEAMK
jgi:hypothetical protein